MNCKSVLCYGGKNKLIIKFKDDIDNKSFFIFCYSNKIQITKNINIIMNNKIQSLYESIFNNVYDQNINKKIIVSFEEYKNNNKNLYNLNQYNPFQENLLSFNSLY